MWEVQIEIHLCSSVKLDFHWMDFPKTHTCLMALRVHHLYWILSKWDANVGNVGKMSFMPILSSSRNECFKNQ
jgi:hypothetical protein